MRDGAAAVFRRASIWPHLGAEGLVHSTSPTGAGIESSFRVLILGLFLSQKTGCIAFRTWSLVLYCVWSCRRIPSSRSEQAFDCLGKLAHSSSCFGSGLSFPQKSLRIVWSSVALGNGALALARRYGKVNSVSYGRVRSRYFVPLDPSIDRYLHHLIDCR